MPIFEEGLEVLLILKNRKQLHFDVKPATMKDLYMSLKTSYYQIPWLVIQIYITRLHDNLGICITYFRRCYAGLPICMGDLLSHSFLTMHPLKMHIVFAATLTGPAISSAVLHVDAESIAVYNRSSIADLWSRCGARDCPSNLINDTAIEPQDPHKVSASRHHKRV